MPPRVVVDVAFVDPDSALPANRLPFGYFINGRRVSEREALAAHRRGESVVTREIGRAEVPVRERRN